MHCCINISPYVAAHCCPPLTNTDLQWSLFFIRKYAYVSVITLHWYKWSWISSSNWQSSQIVMYVSNNSYMLYTLHWDVYLVDSGLLHHHCDYIHYSCEWSEDSPTVWPLTQNSWHSPWVLESLIHWRCGMSHKNLQICITPKSWNVHTCM